MIPSIPITFHGMFAFQHRHPSERCCRIVRALFAFTPCKSVCSMSDVLIRSSVVVITSGIISRMSCMTAALSSRSKCDSTLCLVTCVIGAFTNNVCAYVYSSSMYYLPSLQCPLSYGLRTVLLANCPASALIQEKMNHVYKDDNHVSTALRT